MNADELKSHRARLGLSVDELAELLGVPVALARAWEGPTAPQPPAGFLVLLRLMAEFDLSADDVRRRARAAASARSVAAAPPRPAARSASTPAAKSAPDAAPATRVVLTGRQVKHADRLRGLALVLPWPIGLELTAPIPSGRKRRATPEERRVLEALLAEPADDAGLAILDIHVSREPRKGGPGAPIFEAELRGKRWLAAVTTEWPMRMRYAGQLAAPETKPPAAKARRRSE